MSTHWALPLLLTLTHFVAGEVSITFSNARDANELSGHDFYQPAPLIDSIAILGFRSLIDLVTPNSNVILSPLNLYSCLDVLHLGAAGETKDELSRIIVNSEDNHTLTTILSTLHGTTHASAAFFSPEIAPKSDFIRDSHVKYQTEILNLDFTNPAGAASAVNSWVAEKTNGTIKEVLHGSLDPTAKLVVVNALLFNGKWLHPFSPLVTEMGRFDIDDQQFVNVPMMHLETYLPVIIRKDYMAVSLPYKDGDLSMYVILPHNHGIDELRRVLYSLTPTDLVSFALSQPQRIFVEMPKFTIETHLSMKEALSRQGLKTTFDPETGNFTNFSDPPVSGIYVSDIYHSVHLEVNEHETIASAASAAIFTKTRYLQFKARRPFIFLISNKDRLVLFAGVVVRPQ